MSDTHFAISSSHYSHCLFFSGEEQREKLQELKEETKISVDKVIKEIEDREEQIRPKQE